MGLSLGIAALMAALLTTGLLATVLQIAGKWEAFAKLKDWDGPRRSYLLGTAGGIGGGVGNLDRPLLPLLSPARSFYAGGKNSPRIDRRQHPGTSDRRPSPGHDQRGRRLPLRPRLLHRVGAGHHGSSMVFWSGRSPCCSSAKNNAANNCSAGASAWAAATTCGPAANAVRNAAYRFPLPPGQVARLPAPGKIRRRTAPNRCTTGNRYLIFQGSLGAERSSVSEGVSREVLAQMLLELPLRHPFFAEIRGVVADDVGINQGKAAFAHVQQETAEGGLGAVGDAVEERIGGYDRA